MHNSSEDMGLNLSPGEGREKRTEKQDSIWAVRGSTGVEFKTHNLKIMVSIWLLARRERKWKLKKSDDMGSKRQHGCRIRNT